MTKPEMKVEERFEIQATGFYDASKELIVSNNEDYISCQTVIGEINSFVKQVKGFMDPHIARANAVHKELTKDRKRLLDPALQAKTMYQLRGQAYRDEQEDKVRAERRLVEQAEEERRKQAQIKALAKAQEAEQKGDVDLAEEILDQALVTLETAPPPPPAPPAVPMVAGVGQRRHFKAELIAPKEVSPDMLMIDAVRDKLEAAAQKMATATDGKTPIPGFRVTTFYKQTNRKV